MKKLPKIINKEKFVLECHAYTAKKNTLRGIHFQSFKPQCQLLTLITGKITLVLIDLRYKSSTFKKIGYFNLNYNDNNVIFMPTGVASAYLTKTNNVNIFYKMNKFFSKSNDNGIKWDCKNLKINWSTNNPILSPKDKKNPQFDFYDFKRLNLK
jgi:dTDP-4-dehydrorhamnose 3,5-epimerase